MFQATHLIVFLPPCLGAFVLSNHSSHNSAFFKFSSPDASASEGPTACVKQAANFPLPSLLSNQSDTLTKARAAAAEGYLSPFTIPLLAEPETLVQPARLNWVLRFPLPPPNPLSNRRFSSTPSYHYGPRTPQALDAAIRYAANFSYDDPTPTHPQAAAFVQLPDPIIKFGDVRRPTTEPPSPPPPDFQKDVPRPPCIDLERAILGFNIDNSAAFQAIEDSKALHARRWQTKEGTYRIKRRALPDVRDAPLQDDNAAASCSDGKPRWRCWDGDYAMGYQHHP